MLAKLKATSLFATQEVKDRLQLINTPTKTMPVDDSNGWAYPGDLCCTLYDYTNYGGDSIDFCLDETHSPKSWWLDNYGWDDRMESWVCGRNVASYFCFDDETCKGNNSIIPL